MERKKKTKIEESFFFIIFNLPPIYKIKLVSTTLYQISHFFYFYFNKKTLISLSFLRNGRRGSMQSHRSSN